MDGLQDEEWLHYSYVGHTETWKVVLLSLNINPKFAELEKDHYAYFSETTIKKIGLDRRKYSGNVTESQIKERYEIIEKRKYDGDYVYDDFTVDVEKFVKFANKLNLKPFPEKFLLLFKTTENSNTENKKVTNQKNNFDFQSETPSGRNTYSKAIERVFREHIKAGKALPNIAGLLKIFEENIPDGIFAVDAKKRTITYQTRTAEKIADIKAIEAAISRIERKIKLPKS